MVNRTITLVWFDSSQNSNGSVQFFNPLTRFCFGFLQKPNHTHPYIQLWLILCVNPQLLRGKGLTNMKFGEWKWNFVKNSFIYVSNPNSLPTELCSRRLYIEAFKEFSSDSMGIDHYVSLEHMICSLKYITSPYFLV